MFIYSRRSGTPADKMPQLDYKTKQQRIDRLIKRQFEISKRIAGNAVGKTVEILVSEKKGDRCFGKAQNDAAVAFDSKTAQIGDFVNVKITSAKNANLMGDIII